MKFKLGDRVFHNGTDQKARIIGTHVAGYIIQLEETSDICHVAENRLSRAEYLDWKKEVWKIHKRYCKKSDNKGVEFLVMGMVGEAGEVANVIKKKWRGDSNPTLDKQLVEELTDVRIYLELIAQTLDIDLDQQCSALLPKLYRKFPGTSPLTRKDD